ncbi:MAG TPA: ABC transporter substrate-binding protein [Thermoanaerobaculia bacterium]|jgi:ABC-type nitrate/sulfonate/bicarbonate transport system substrate-binding protein|nr:ABC transporter substrate-binding protein [Thermoanaerobaculia bacterium]
MRRIRLALLRGICQLPAYVAIEEGFFAAQDLAATPVMAPTAWAVPDRLRAGEVDFAVIPWTRVAADPPAAGNRLVLIAGSGIEEAALVVRTGLAPEEVRRVAVPHEGGIKDLTAMALIRRLRWQDVRLVRQPSGDGAILSFVGHGADAAAMVEPYAAMLEFLGLGRVLLRTGDVWPGAPGCSLTTTSALIEREPELVQRVTTAYVAAARRVLAAPEEAARIGEGFIGVSAEIVLRALAANRPDPQAIRNDAAMAQVLALMADLGYLRQPADGYRDLRFLEVLDR